MTRESTVCAPIDASAADLVAAERTVVDAAVLWVADQSCASALACLEDAVAEYLGTRRAARAIRTETVVPGAGSSAPYCSTTWRDEG